MFMLDWRRSCCKNNLLLGQENSLNNVGDTDTVIRNTEDDELGGDMMTMLDGVYQWLWWELDQ